MADEQILVNVKCRGFTLLEGVPLGNVEQSTAFLGSSSPLPVGTCLMVTPVGRPGAELSAQVTRVVEVRKSARSETLKNAGMDLSFVLEGMTLQEALAQAEVPEPEEPAAADSEQASLDFEVSGDEDPAPAIVLTTEPEQQPAEDQGAGDNPEPEKKPAPRKRGKGRRRKK